MQCAGAALAANTFDMALRLTAATLSGRQRTTGTVDPTPNNTRTVVSIQVTEYQMQFIAGETLTVYCGMQSETDKE